MLKLASIFQSEMVLQRDKPVKIWGSTTANTVVKIQIQEKQTETVADGKGDFVAELEPLTVSEDETLIVTSERSEVKLEHVAIGEVWIAGGQSNMEFFMEFEKHISEERMRCENSHIRFYDIPEIAFDGQQEAFDYSKTGIWRPLTKENIGYYSAVGYYFEKEINAALDVPVGIIGCSWSGTRIASWMNPETVRKEGKFWIDEYEKESAGLDMSAYFEEQKSAAVNDRGSLLDDPFLKFMLPTTHTPEENRRFLENFGAVTEFFLNPLNPQNIPGSLYTHMVKTIAGYTNRGVLWYQGESDDEIDGGQKIYGDMLTAMISDWRELWGEDLPFLIVQLPGWESWLANKNKDYVTIRREQKRVTERVKNTYLCSISDVGERFDIHPKNKKIVGIRLAMLALGHIYNKGILCDAPDCADGRRAGNAIVLTFSNAGKGLKVEGEQINALEVTYAGKKALFRTSVLDNEVSILFDKIPESPITVSFAQTAWYQINLYNSAGIPAIPFQIIV